MNHSKTVALTAILLFAAEAQADGFSVGASIGSASLEADSANVGIDFDSSDTAWKIYGQYMFSDRWGIEVGYVDFGNPSETALAITANIELAGFNAFVVGSVPLSEKLNLFGKIGLLSWDGEVTVSGLGNGDADDTDLALGFGGRYQLSDRFAIVGEAEWYDASEAESLTMLSVGIALSFD